MTQPPSLPVGHPVPPVPDKLFWILQRAVDSKRVETGAEEIWKWFHEHYANNIESVWYQRFKRAEAERDQLKAHHLRKVADLADRLARAEATIERVRNLLQALVSYHKAELISAIKTDDLIKLLAEALADPTDDGGKEPI